MNNFFLYKIILTLRYMTYTHSMNFLNKRSDNCFLDIDSIICEKKNLTSKGLQINIG